MKDQQDTLFPWEDAPPPASTADRSQDEVQRAVPAVSDEVQRAVPAVSDEVQPAVPELSDDARGDARGDSRRSAAGGAQGATEGEVPASPAEPGHRVAQTPTQARPLIRKEYYAISEVSDLVGLPAHVLRYWESQFSVLNPSKNRSGNRVYQRKEIKLILLVKQLLHEEKYTVEGAKQKLEQLRRGGRLGVATVRALDEQLVNVLREDLHELGELLKAD
ncbi:hypothetical protein BH23GEM9_BH23GEM9_04690 [soil metagenome]